MSRISCVRSRTLRSSAASRLRSCAGLSSLSKTTMSTSASAQAAASVATLPLPRKVAASGRPAFCSTRSATVAPAADARPASSSSECSGSKWRVSPVKRPTSAARSRVPGAVERDAARVTAAILARGPTRSPPRAPASARRRARRRSSTVARPGWSPRRTRSRSPRRTRRAPRCAAAAGGEPVRFALVAVTHPSSAPASARAAGWSGTRTATVPSSAGIPCPTSPVEVSTSVNGPGQNVSASRLARSVSRPTRAASSTLDAISGIACPAARPLTANSRAIAVGDRGSTARP